MIDWTASVLKVRSSSGNRDQELAWKRKYKAPDDIRTAAEDAGLLWFDETDQSGLCDITLLLVVHGIEWVVDMTVRPRIVVDIERARVR